MPSWPRPDPSLNSLLTLPLPSRHVGRRHWIILAAVVVASFALHADRALHPTTSYQSADERSYGKLAVTIAERGDYGDRSMSDPLHWPPGAPMLFALGHRLFGSEASLESYDLPSAYWLHAILGVATALAAFVLARALAGPGPGVLAAGLVGLYPPLILATGEQVSEPLGAFLFTAAMAAFAMSAHRRSLPGYAVTGALLGATVLTRADLLLVPAIVAGLCLVVLWWRRSDPRRGVAVAAVLVAGTAVAVLPWITYASIRADRLVPVTQGSASPFFVGTYLPGDGHTVGMKRALEAEVKRFRPSLQDIPAFEIEAANYLDMIAARHPRLTRDEALRREARRNLSRYATGEPLRFLVMMGDKVQRMWSRYARGGARATSPVFRAWHIVLVVLGFAGLVLGVWRGRSVVLAAVLLAALYSTALHMLVVSQARYNLPLMPAVIAGGVAGWALWRAGRREADGTVPDSVRASMDRDVGGKYP